MKQKIYITFEVHTELEVDVPETNNTLTDYVLGHKSEIVAAARKKVLDNGIDNQLSWDNMYWGTLKPSDIDMSDITFEI